MRYYGVVVYWLGCAWVIINLFFSSDWLAFIDLVSLAAVLVPSVAALATRKGEALSEKISRAVKVSWLSGGTMCLYSAVSVLSQFDVDAEALRLSFAIVLLPILYCFIISLLAAPFLFSGDKKEVQQSPHQQSK